MSAAASGVGVETSMGARPQCSFLDNVSIPYQETDALAKGHSRRVANRIGQIGTGLECIETLSLLRRRFDLERAAAEDGNAAHLLESRHEEALLSGIELLATMMQDALREVIANGREEISHVRVAPK